MLSTWSLQDVLMWLNENNLSTLVPLFRVNQIDGKELDRIREKNDSKVSFQILCTACFQILVTFCDVFQM